LPRREIQELLKGMRKKREGKKPNKSVPLLVRIIAQERDENFNRLLLSKRIIPLYKASLTAAKGLA